MDEQTQIAPQIELRDFHIPRYRELPDFGLRLEQVTKFVSRYVPAPITGSMVSNYVKQRIIPAPEKKSYGVDAIAYLIVVSYLKNTVSLDQVRLLLGVQQNSYSLAVAYDYFCDELENLLSYVSGTKPAPDIIGNTRTPQKDLLRTALLSITYKIYLEYRLQRMEEAT